MTRDTFKAKGQGPDEVHCTTCSCEPNMTPAVRFNTTLAERDGAVRDHLIHMGWTPPVGVEGLREIYSAVIRALAAIVTTGGSDKIEELGAIPRSPVMDQVAAIRGQMDKLSALAQQPASETVTVQQAWEWAGGNPGIMATREDLEQALRDLDAVCDEADQQHAAVDVARLVEAARNLRRRQREYLEQPKGERDNHKGRLVGDAARELDEALAPFTAALTQQPAARRQYFYKVNDCPADGPREPDCICWHDEGTGPLADGSAKTWRNAPAQQPAAVDGAWLAKAQGLYDRCSVYPENNPDGFMALLELRNHVHSALAQQPAPPYTPLPHRRIHE